MPVPKRKLSRKRRDQRSANKHIFAKPFSICPQENFSSPIISHRVCSNCGFYSGESIIKINAKKNK